MEEFDIVIVGAGSAGAPLAARLSEDPSIRVLLLEAGRNYRPAEAPQALTTTEMGASLNWPDLPEYYWLGVKARRTVFQPHEFYWRGRGVGGSSAINGQVALRPPLDDFDLWGVPGWSGDAVLPYFLKLEDDEDFGDRPEHQRGGPIPIHREPEGNWSALDLAFKQAALSNGFDWAPDCNVESTGCSPYPFNSRDGRRITTNDAYLEPARDRANLVIRGGCIVDRIDIAGGSTRGLSVLSPDGRQDIRAGRVILSAGTVGSAAILMRSGIGPADALRSLGISVVADLPVGENIQDHVVLPLGFPMNPAGAQGLYRPVVCVRYSSGHPDAAANDLFLGASGPMDAANQIGMFLPWLNQPFSRGKLTIKSADPQTDPMIDIRLLSDERDVTRLLQGVRRVMALRADPAFDDVITGPVAGADGTTIDELAAFSDTEFGAYAVHHARDVAHLACSCPMGVEGDAAAVVDPTTAVHGVANLNVVDISILPSLTRANTHLTAVMLAERVADQLRGA